MTTLAQLLHPLPSWDTAQCSSALMEREVTQITADSREVIQGSLFVAIAGAKIDGRLFIADAIRKGCVAVVTEKQCALDAAVEATVPIIRVPDCHEAIAELAAAWYGYPARQMQLIGITGTNGKTTCSWLIEKMLLAAGHRPGVIGTVNYRYHDANGVHIIQDAPLTTPDPLALQGILRTMADKAVSHVVMEVSSHALHQKRLGRTCFDVALFTNLSRDHLDYHPNITEYFVTKEQLFQQHLKPNGKAVIVVGPCAEGQDWGENLCRSLTKPPLIRCGLSSCCDVGAEAIQQSVEGFRCQLRLAGPTLDFASLLTGSYNILNVLAAAGVGIGLGLTAPQISAGLSQLDTVPGRLERVRLPGTVTISSPAVFVDYAHSPDALDNVLLTLKSITTGRLICVFGCGGDRDRGKRPQMGAIAARHADVVIVTSDNPRSEQAEAIIAEIVPGVEAGSTTKQSISALFGTDQSGAEPLPGYALLPDRHTAINTAITLAQPGDTVLIAGKGHEDYQIIGSTKHFFDDRIEAINALIHWNSRHLLTALASVGGKVVAGKQGRLFGQITSDSRSLAAGDIFIALKGEKFDGNHYIEAAVTQGAAVIIGEEMPATFQEGVLYIQVHDSLRALGDLAGYRRRLLGPMAKVLAVTGSSGKTTVKEMLAAICAEAVPQKYSNAADQGSSTVLKTQGNFNNLVGLPLSLLPLTASHRLAILEMGMNAPGEIARLTEILDPDVGCINNVHPAHLQGLGSVEGVAAAKGELFAGMRPEAIRVVNCDDPLVRVQARKSGGQWMGFASTPAGRKQHPLVRVTRQENLGERGMRFTLHIGTWQQRMTVPVCGSHNVSNCAAAATLAHAAGIAPEIIARALQAYASTTDKRLAITELPGGLQVVNDAYNANPASMTAGLRTVAAFGAEYAKNRPCRHVAALGEMLELGPTSATLHARIGTIAAELGYKQLLLCGEQATHIAQAACAAGMDAAAVHIFPQPQDMAEAICQSWAQGTLRAGDWLLIKGSRGMRMERLLDALHQRFAKQSATQTRG